MVNLFKEIPSLRWMTLFLFVAFILGLGIYVTDKMFPGPCDHLNLGHPDRLDCLYPNPPIGRWHAAYTKEFAEVHKLPPENISTDFSPGVDYMEMEVMPFGNGGTACMVNMLIRKPHDVAFLNLGNRNVEKLPEDRKLIHLINIDKYKNNLEALTSFNSASRDYNQKTRGYRSSTFAMYAEDVLPEYDYISANAKCRLMSISGQYFPDRYALWAAKASIWGKYETPYESYNNPKTPKGMDFYHGHLFINIPHEIVSAIFKDVPVGGR